MARKKSLQKRLGPYLTSQNILVGAFAFLSLFAVFVLLIRNNSPDEAVAINEDQIRMEKDGEIITINKNGLVEYRTEDTVTYKIWDSNKVSAFFDAVENKARDYQENPNTDTSNCVFVSLYLDGELVTICFSEDDDVIQEAYEDFTEEDDTISLSDLFDDDGDEDSDGDGDGDISDFFNITPTPTPAPTSTPGGEEEVGDSELPPPLPVEATCESWEEQIVGGRAIISNTLCSVSSPEE